MNTVNPRPKLDEVIISKKSRDTLVAFIGSLTMGQMVSITKRPQETKDIHDAYTDLLYKPKEDKE